MNVEDEVEAPKARVAVLTWMMVAVTIILACLGADALLQSWRIDSLM